MGDNVGFICLFVIFIFFLQALYVDFWQSGLIAGTTASSLVDFFLTGGGSRRVKGRLQAQQVAVPLVFFTSPVCGFLGPGLIAGTTDSNPFFLTGGVCRC